MSAGAAVTCPKCASEANETNVGKSTQSNKNLALRVPADCQECLLNYKAEVRRWKKEPARKQAWENKTPEERTDWYVKRKTVTEKLNAYDAVNRKRRASFDTTSVNHNGHEERVRMHWKPWSVFKEERNAAGDDDDVALQKFRVEAMNEQRPTKVILGQVHLGYYQGVFEDGVRGHREEHAASVSDELTSKVDIDAALVSMSKRMKKQDDWVKCDGLKDVIAADAATVKAAKAVPSEYVRGLVQDETPVHLSEDWLALLAVTGDLQELSAVQQELEKLDQEDASLAASLEVDSEESSSSDTS